MASETDPDTGRVEGDQIGRIPAAGPDQNDYTHSDSGNSGKDSQSESGAGTAGSVPQAGPGAPQPYK